MKGIIPNLFTMANLVCGCLSIFFAFSEVQLELACYFIMAGAFFDLFDGFFARLLKVQGEMGKQLDSLADAVTFGVAPGMMVFIMLTRVADVNYWPSWIGYGAFLLVIASIYRLAKFNIDTRQSDSFRGLPTPSNALFWIGMVHWYSFGRKAGGTPPEGFVELGIPHASWSDVLFHEVRSGFLEVLFHPVSILVLIVGMSLWMISDIPMLALKFKDFGFRGNRARYLLIASGLLLGLVAKLFYRTVFIALPIVLFLYLLISLGYNYLKRNHEVPR